MHTPFGAELPNLTWQHISKGRGPSDPQFWQFLSIYAYTICRRTTTFDVITHMGRGLIFGISQASTPTGRGPSAPNFLWFPFIYAHTLWRKTTKFDLVSCGGRACILESATPPSQETGVPGSQFCRFPVFMSLPFNTERPNSAWGRVFSGGQPCHCICTNASRGLSATAEFLVFL